MRFAYIAVQDSGERAAGTLRCPSRREAVAKLLELGYHPVSVESEHEQRFEAGVLLRRVFRRVRASELAVFTRQLAALLKAGLPIVSALGTLERQSPNKGLQLVISEIRAALQQDAMTLAEAMAEHPRVFGAVYCGLVRSGEEGGRLVEVLDGLAKHLARSARLRGQVMGAFIYPAFLLLLGVAAIFVLMAFVIPKFQTLFASFGRELPLPTRMLISVSGFLDRWWWAVLLLAAAAVVGAILSLRRKSVRLQLDTALLKLPVLGPMVLKLEAARIARTLGALLRGGVRIVAALEITAETVQNLAVRQAVWPLVSAVSSGDGLGPAMERAKLYPPVMVNLVRTGEETGELPEMLDELAEIYDDEAERAVNGAVKLLEPALIVVMAIIIAGIVAAVMLPIFQSSAMVA